MTNSSMHTRLRNLFARGTLLLVNAAARVQKMQVRLLGDEVGDNLENFEHYGLTSNPPAGLEAAVFFVGGSRDHGVVVGIADRQFRIKALKPGEVALYTDEGDKIELLRDRKMRLTTLHLAVDAQEDATVNTKAYTVNSETYQVNASQSASYATPSWNLGSNGGGCNAAINADINQNGSHTSTGDQIANGISQVHHLHKDVQPGSGTTGEPQ